MAEKILMLALSPTMETGTIAKWLKKEGDPVTSGDVLCEVETDKAVMDYESPASGVLLKIILPDGSSASIGDLMAIIGKEGEDISGLLAASASQEKAPSGQAVQAGLPPKEETAAKEQSQAKASPPPKPEAEVASPVPKPEAAGGFIKSSPLARNLAKISGLNLERIQGSGPDGRIIKADVDKAAVLAAAQPDLGGSAQPDKGDRSQPDSIPAASPLQDLQDVILPVTGKRKVIARRVSESMFSAPHYYLKVPVEMHDLLEARKRLNAMLDIKISINAFLIKFTAIALKRHPIINSTWSGDTIVQHGRIDIGLAVAQKDGLITPVVRDCGNKGISQIEQELQELIPRARTNSLKLEEYTGATFTISNLGSYGIEEFTAIINPPGSAILAVGEIKKEAVVQPDDSIKVRSVMRLVLSCDHRVIDGSVGAEFLTDLRNMLEDPVLALY